MAGIVDMAMCEGSTNASCVEAFLKDILVPKLNPGKIVVLDNAPVHNLEYIQKHILEPAGLKMLPLPRYSPDLSPIELLWSKIKGIIRRISPRSIEELYQALDFSFHFIDGDDIQGWFEHCGYEVQDF